MTTKTTKDFDRFDELFPRTMQSSSGLGKLDDVEKRALCAHVEKLLRQGEMVNNIRAEEARTPRIPLEGEAYGNLGNHKYLEKNISDGMFILLDDGSLWLIRPDDRGESAAWSEIENISVIKSKRGNPDYKYTLVNTEHGEQADAQYLGGE